MTEAIKEKKLRSLYDPAAVAAIFVSFIQGLLFVLDGWTIYNIAAICLALANLFFAIQFLRQDYPETLWRVFVSYLGQLIFFVVRLVDREPLIVPRLLVMLVLLMHVFIVLSVGIGARRLITKPKLILLPFLFVTVIFFLEAGLHLLPSSALPKKKVIEPEWVGDTEYHPDLGMIYRPHSELKSYYPNNPRGYFKEENSNSKKWSLRASEGAEVNLVFPQENPGTARIDIKKTPTRSPTDIQLNMPQLKVKKNVRYSVEFRARADLSRSIFVGFAKFHEPWDGLGLYTKINLTPDWQLFKIPFKATATDKNARILFDVGESEIPVEVSNAHLFNVRKKEIVDSGHQSQKGFVSYRFNSTGCRGRDYAIPKPTGTKRILILGNAYALGVGVHEEDTLSHQMEQLLNKQTSTFEVINCGINDYKTQQERMFYESYGRRYEPDVVLVLMTVEDQIADMETFPVKENIFLSWSKFFDRENDRVPSFARSVTEILQLNTEVRKHGGRTAVVFFRVNGDKQGSTNDGRIWNDLTHTVTNGLRASDIPVLDLQKPLHQKYSDKQLIVHPKIGQHPNEISHGIAAREILSFVQSRKL